MILPSAKDGESNQWEKMLKVLPSWSKKSTCTWEIPGSSYIALFRPLQDVRSRFILIIAILLAIAAGVPLPIIGVIFARIINAFPPSEDEIRTRIYQLLTVGECCIFFP